NSALLTQCGMIVGTPTYMAPEQADSHPADARSDLFSLGCVLYEAASGHRTFEGNSVISVLKATATQEPRPLHELRPDMPVSLSRIVMRMLAKDPERRPQSATEVAEVLESLVAQLSSVVEPSASKQHQWLLGAAMARCRSKNARLVAITLGVIGVGIIWLAPDWVPRPFAITANGGKDGAKSNRVPAGSVRGITDDEIVLGISAATTGPASDLGRQMVV